MFKFYHSFLIFKIFESSHVVNVSQDYINCAEHFYPVTGTRLSA